jgi:hypothetical protein
MAVRAIYPTCASDPDIAFADSEVGVSDVTVTDTIEALRILACRVCAYDTRTGLEQSADFYPGTGGDPNHPTLDNSSFPVLFTTIGKHRTTLT